MQHSEERLERMIEKLKKNKYRVTPQRIAILRILASSKDHPSAEWIHKRVKADFPTTSLATVYKTVALAKHLGEVMELGFSDDRNRYDGNNPAPHPHLICVQCKKILDPDLKTLGQMTSELADDTGFQILSHRLDFFGICPQCRK
ncbi:MAG: transcriptional repressor [Deltaproteobacteria bacterium]|nr:transcriptional repressor [Deltaproteobacteria bacterium]MBW1962057.1 transcriptional repressor [Deltaproteobacteria bacterium]MBW1993341.1 transcriptional repressor [Deltaproteobacteria bacterium]MBW2150771.1 transcriptional repressor [Deltaproteobacteria bacterium]